MRVLVLYFAAAREAAGRGSETFDVAPGSTVASLLELAARTRPALAPLLPSIRAAVGERFATGADALDAGDTVALLPPVGGG